jgi:hypothetical protein
MESSRQWGRLILRAIKDTLIYLLPTASMIVILLTWHQLTPCFQRQAVVLSFFLFYFTYMNLEEYTIFFGVGGFAGIFWWAEILNKLDCKKDPLCLATNHNGYLIAILILFKTLWILLTIGFALHFILCIFFYMRRRSRSALLEEVA